jgi:Family of unknown function (DUF6236)
MGEAKRRRVAEERKSVSGVLARGLILPDPVRVDMSDPNDSESVIFSSKPIDPDVFLSAVLYWDKIICPANNIFYQQLDQEEFLRKEGILSRPHHLILREFDQRQLDLRKLIESTQLALFEAFEAQQPGYWCIANEAPITVEQTNFLTSNRSAMITLTNALPLPPAGTQFDDVLEFKSKRRAELENLRSKIDELYLRIVDSADIAMAERVVTKELGVAIDELTTASTEWWKDIQPSDTKSIVNLGLSAAAAYSVGSVFMPSVASIAGVAGAVLSIAGSVGMRLKNIRKSPYWYAVNVKKSF